MGSAHFLTVVALEIAKEIAWVEVFDKPQPEAHFEFLENPEPWASVSPVHAEELKRRMRGYLPEVVRRCCYGVDLKPLACELGKLALWLFTMTAEPEERPELTFVDGNLRTGNSLVGVTWTEATEILRHYLGWDVGTVHRLFGSELVNQRKELDEISKEMRAESGDLRAWLVKHGEIASNLPNDDHLLRQRALAKLREKMSAIRWVYDLAVLAVWYPRRDDLLAELRKEAADARLLPRDADKVDWSDLMMGKGAHNAKTRDVARASVRQLAKAHRAFHWQLEFPDVMDGGRF